MRRWALLFILGASVACSDDGASAFIGESDVTASGILTRFDRSDTVDIALMGNACERLGLISVRSQDGASVLVFDPSSRPLEVGTYVMQWDWNAGPAGWLNARAVTMGGSLLTIRGTTLITSITSSEVRGAIDWAVGVPPDIGVPPDPAIGEVVMRGTFRAARLSSDRVC